MLASGSIDSVITISSADEWTKGASRLLCAEAGGLYASIYPQWSGSDEYHGFGLFADDSMFTAIADLLSRLGYKTQIEA
jgi:hypothetical protein